MVIQLVSYKASLRANSRLKHTANIINSSKADLILFSGHTLASEMDVFELNSLIENKTTTAILEVKENAISLLNPVRNSLFMLKCGVVKDMYTHQLFTDSATINAYPELCNHLLLELETRRSFETANRNVIVIQCGENGILRNKQSEENKAVFRFEDDKELSQRFATILGNTHIVLNPIHSPMGNQGKMKKRREYYSNNNRAYFSAANFSDDESINNKSLQYACINGIEQEPIDIEIGAKNAFIIRTFVIQKDNDGMMEDSKPFLINLQIWNLKSKTIWVKFIIWFAIIATMNGITTKVQVIDLNPIPLNFYMKMKLVMPKWMSNTSNALNAAQQKIPWGGIPK